MGRNVVMIIWESMAKEWVGGLNRQIPNYPTHIFRRLSAGSLLCDDRCLCLRHTIGRCHACTLGSITRPGQPFVTSPYAGNGLTALLILRRAGYYTAFFSHAQKMVRWASMPSLEDGFRCLLRYGRYNNPKDFDGGWGIWDEEFAILRTSAQHLPPTLPPLNLPSVRTTPFHLP